MCERPLTINGYEVSCRECGQCMATYKNTWVARCVAELKTSRHAYALTLTYADVDGTPPLGAKVFRYKDVQDLWKRLRAAADYKWPDEEFDMRYVVVGEKGTRFGRCHYHAVLFTSHDLAELGTFASAKGDKFLLKKRLNWTLWGKGFVEFDECDRKGISYVLKYILKGRMTAEKAKGHRHEGKTEWLASSYLWCSKRPSVGAVWLWNALRQRVEVGLCPPSLRMKVPDGGDWFVAGELQREMCLYLRQANIDYRAEHGRDLAGWRTLVASVQDEIENSETGEIVRRKPWEYLINGEEEEEVVGRPEYAEQQFAEFERQYAQFRRDAARIRGARKTVERCGNIAPCDTCAASVSGKSLRNAYQEERFRRSQWEERFPRASNESDKEYRDRWQDWWRSRLRPSTLCQLRYTNEVVSDFRALIPLERARPKTRYRAAIGKALQAETDK